MGAFSMSTGPVHLAGRDQQQIPGAEVVDLFFDIVCDAARPKHIKFVKIVAVKVQGMKVGLPVVIGFKNPLESSFGTG